MSCTHLVAHEDTDILYRITQYSRRLSYILAYGSPHTCVALTSPYLHTIKTVHTEIKSGIKHAYHHDQAESSPCQVALP